MAAKMRKFAITREELEEEAVEIVKDRLYFAAFDGPPPSGGDIYCFSIDNQYFYEEFCLDFGPLHLGHTFRFCKKVNAILADPDKQDCKIYFYSCSDKKYRSNAGVLICAFAVLCLNRTPDEAFQPLVSIAGLFEPFHDASYYPCPYILTVKDCIDGLYRAWKLNFFSFPDFDVEEYEYYGDIDNGDLNWLVQDKFLAFTGPFEERKHYGNGYYSSVPSDFIDYFKKKNVTAVIRLNKPCYDASHFTNAGINHYHLFYPDGGNPPARILDKFIEICEQEKGAIAVHCKAGLGRTGTCIGMYLMKHYDITAKEIIGWFRIARPGSVIGPQQDFLEEHQRMMHLRGKAHRKKLAEARLKDSQRIKPIHNDSMSVEISEDSEERLKSTRDSLLVEQDDLMINMRSSFISKDGRLSMVGMDRVQDHESKELDFLDEELPDDEVIPQTVSELDAEQGLERVKKELNGVLEQGDTQGDILNKLRAQHHKSLRKDLSFVGTGDELET